MRLINCNTLQLEEFFEDDTPRYAILSHRWGKEEVGLQQFLSGEGIVKSKAGYTKIVNFCALAKSKGHGYGWVDTCCIDKTSSAELSEAINSMYAWYEKATTCYAYLDDVELQEGWEDGFSASVWFRRGWTLQELLAPRRLVFYTKSWSRIGDKKGLSRTIATITSIDINAIERRVSMDRFSIAQRFSWASERKTTRREDIAYCLLGILRVHMPLLYGEGSNAFRRLQEEIMKVSADQSILTWSFSNILGDEDPSFVTAVSPLALSPENFAKAGKIVPYRDDSKEMDNGSLVVINKSLQITLPILQRNRGSLYAILSCHYANDFLGPIGIPVQRQGTSYTRIAGPPKVIPLPFVVPVARKTIRLEPPNQRNVFLEPPAGFIVIVKDSSYPNEPSIYLPSVYPYELWNNENRTFNFPPGGKLRYYDEKSCALLFRDGGHDIVFIFGYQRIPNYNPFVIRSRFWCDYAELTNGDDLEKIWKKTSKPRDGVWNTGFQVRTQGWMVTWTFHISEKKLMGHALWVVSVGTSDRSLQPSTDELFVRGEPAVSMRA
jgi:hypothetical protein